MSFAKQLKTESGGIITCTFIQSYSEKGVRYYVNIIDSHSKANLLIMELINHRWKIADPHHVPRWILEIEALLERAIFEWQQGGAVPAPQRIVLHVDDDPEDRELLEEAFKKLDPTIVVRQAESGDAALSFLKQSKHFHDLPCLIVLDMNMPGLNGKDILREIKKDEELASLPLVIFTTASEKTYKELLEKEHVALLTKPSSPTELVESAKKLLSHCPPHNA